MPTIKISFPESDYNEVCQLAELENLSVQNYIRFKLLGKKPPQAFTVEEATKRAIQQYAIHEEFTLPDIYGDQWAELEPRMTGMFGKKFYENVENVREIEFIGMTANGRRANYRIVEHS